MVLYFSLSFSKGFQWYSAAWAWGCHKRGSPVWVSACRGLCCLAALFHPARGVDRSCSISSKQG